MITESGPPHLGVVVVGAGFGGLAAAHALRGRGEDFAVLERGQEVGGVWRDNTYPGCACDIPSHLYSLSFAPNPHWTHAFSGQSEIGEYLRRVAREHGLLPHIRFGCSLLEAAWDDAAQRWRIDTAPGRWHPGVSGERIAQSGEKATKITRIRYEEVSTLSGEPPITPGQHRRACRTRAARSVSGSAPLIAVQWSTIRRFRTAV